MRRHTHRSHEAVLVQLPAPDKCPGHNRNSQALSHPGRLGESSFNDLPEESGDDHCRSRAPPAQDALKRVFHTHRHRNLGYRTRLQVSTEHSPTHTVTLRAANQRSPSPATPVRASTRRVERIGLWFRLAKLSILVCVCTLARPTVHGKDICRALCRPAVTPGLVTRRSGSVPAPPRRCRILGLNRRRWSVTGPGLLLFS